MPASGVRYKDVRVAPNSQLAQALVDGDRKKAEAIYQQCERDLARLEGRNYLLDGYTGPIVRSPYALVTAAGI